MSAARVAKALCGCTSAQIPVMAKSVPRSPWTIFQPVVQSPIDRNSVSPAAIATIPNRIETA